PSGVVPPWHGGCERGPYPSIPGLGPRARRRHVRRHRPARGEWPDAGARGPHGPRRARSPALDLPTRVGAGLGDLPHREAARPARRVQLPEPGWAALLGLQRVARQLVLLPGRHAPRPPPPDERPADAGLS